MGILNTSSFYDEEKDAFITGVLYDNSAVIAANIEAQKQAPETGRYKGNLVKVASIDEGDIPRLKSMGYDLLSRDPDEVKRALLYIQSMERNLLTLPGTPIARKRTQWV